MPGATLPNLGLVLPELGGDSGDWDDLLNDMFGLIDAHDHTAGKGVLVPTAGLNINADLPFAGYGPTGLGKAAFNAVTALTAGTKTLFVSAADSELYWRTNAGVNVKLTSGSTINVSLVGGIAGDYTSVGAEVAYDDANDRYTFKQQGSPKTWARLASGDVRLYETGTSETVYVGLTAPAALAVSYDVVFPLAAPGSTSIVQMSSAGVLTASNTVANACTFSAAATFSTSIATPLATITTATVTGAATVGTTLGVTGLITATAGLTAAANQHVTVSGTGTFKHGNVTINQIFDGAIGTLSQGVSTNQPDYTNAAADVFHIQLRGLKTGDQLNALRIVYQPASAAATPVIYLQDLLGATPSTALTFTSATSTDGGSGNTLIDLTLTDLVPLTNMEYLTLKLTTGAGGGTTHWRSLRLTVSRP